MAKKKKAGINMSQAIRDHLADHPDDGAKAIVAAMGKKKIKVTEGLVNNVKYALAGKKKKKRRKKRTTTTQSTVSDKISISTLVQAKKMADQLGGIEKAKTALAALTKLQ